MTTLASRTGIPAVASGGGLQFSDYWYLLALAVAVAVAISSEGDPVANPIVKHLPLMIALPAVVLTFLGRKLRTVRPKEGAIAPLIAAAWPLVLLAALIIGGSVYARFFQYIQNTFLPVGLYMLTAVMAGAMVYQSESPDAFVRAYFRILVAAAIAISILLFVRQGFHELSFLVIPMAAFFFVGARRMFMRFLGLGFFLSMAWLSHKNTSYLVGILTIGYIIVAVAIPRLPKRPTLRRVTAIYWICTVGFLGALSLGLLYLLSDPGSVPTGNVEFRQYMYKAAWERFLSSPVWGTLFAVEPVGLFRLYQINLGGALPTHSDVMDLLAHGGILGVGLLLLAFARVAKFALKSRLLHPSHLSDPWAAYAHALVLMSLAAVIVYAFNPILLQPAKAYLVWSNLGVLLGLSLRAQSR
jgi:hypothetical protein